MQNIKNGFTPLYFADDFDVKQFFQTTVLLQFNEKYVMTQLS